ncbi:MAG: protein-L-isoaspartate(D-aspartate) O-methyltransferase [Verrucomicrobiota bacterium]|nr:protein-L-isoaspartate(D-aspartate) O-methyltransferase [Limisphaera sp.]MDW8382215.1 protein-L-isoaspartate(D-aspartate) O-methyltransferase [Verrucomicrobiota bacterium]
MKKVGLGWWTLSCLGFMSVPLVGCAPLDEPLSEAELRRRMVREQLAGPGREIRHARVLQAMEKVPRHEFVPEAMRAQAYEDRPLPIGYGQTISQPFIVAFMTAQLDPQPGEKILEVGTGSGYQAAILAELGAQVYTIEILGPLAESAAATLRRLGYTNVQIRVGDGYLGWPEAAPFDAIMVTCAPDHVPQPLVDQLREGGRMIIPVGPPGLQELVLLRKSGGKLERRAVLPVLFVPMTGPRAQPPG